MPTPFNKQPVLFLLLLNDILIINLLLLWRGSDKLKDYNCIRIKIIAVYSEMYMIAFGWKVFQEGETHFFGQGCFQSLCVVVLVSRFSWQTEIR